jgi:predicted dehydrogenase
MTNPIGVGVIGASPGPDSWAANSHIPALRALRGFELRAVATSRRASADAAAQAYGVEGFDDARMLIDHPGVDLVVVAVKVTQHYDLVKQALAAGKMVYSEWPLGTTLAEARTLAELAEATGVRTVIGLQSRFAPAVLRMHDLVDEGYLGRILATTLIGSGVAWGATTDRAHAYMFDAANGATTLTVSTGHALDALTYVLGDITSVTATLGIGRGVVQIADEGAVVPVTAPDQIAVTAGLRSGAIASIFYRGGLSRAGDLRWEINGTSGDLLLTSLVANGNIQATELTLAGASTPETTLSHLELPRPAGPELAAIPVGPARNVAALYAAFAKDLAEDTRTVPDFAHALTIQTLIADIQASDGR